MAQMNKKQLSGKENVSKVSKPTKKPPMTAPGKIKIDDSLENPRAYLGSLGQSEAAKKGHSIIAGDLDMHDTERNPNGGIKPSGE